MIFGIIPLQAANERHAQRAGQERIFAVGFLAATPARIAENVDVGRPKSQPVVNVAVAVVRLAVVVVLGAALRWQ